MPTKRAPASRRATPVTAAEPTLADVVRAGERRPSLVAMRDRLAEETNDTTWAKHKADCRCSCGMGDGRVLVALIKELRAVEAEIAALPPVEGSNPIDGIVAKVSNLDGHRRARPVRRANAQGPQGA